jgi:hypothetical protein
MIESHPESCQDNEWKLYLGNLKEEPTTYFNVLSQQENKGEESINFLIPALDKLFPSDFLVEVINYSSLNKIYLLE